MDTTPDAKPTAAGVGAAAGTLLWILLPVYVDSIAELGAEAIAGATGATSFLLGAIAYFAMPRDGQTARGRRKAAGRKS